MSDRNDSSGCGRGFMAALRQGLAETPCGAGGVAISRVPAVADVMGGIAEDSGSLVLAATLGFACSAAVWRTNAPGLRFLVRRGAGRADAAPALVLKDERVFPSGDSFDDGFLEHLRTEGADGAMPACLALRRVVQDGLAPAPDGGGLSIMVHADWPNEADFGLTTIQAAAVIDAFCRMTGVEPDRTRQAVCAAGAVSRLIPGSSVRAALAGLCGPTEGALLQVQFHPHLTFNTLELPRGVVIAGVRTKLERPTSDERLHETRVCSEMGLRIIAELQRADGTPGETPASRLSAIAPAEFVSRFRNRVPGRVKGQTYLARFGGLRGFDCELDPNFQYKVRSRAEHQIYENNRVHEFVSCVWRARRNGDAQALERAGELMYASHWSHSQRCGIGGVEADKVVSLIRARGPAAGLFGAKVTGGGGGGEIVVLMRDDQTARAALAAALTEAEAQCGRPVELFDGSLGGAAFFQAPAFDAAQKTQALS